MNEKEIMQWAIKGINSEITKLDKKLRRELLILQANKKGIVKAKERVEERIDELRADIELLGRKKAFLIVQLDEKN